MWQDVLSCKFLFSFYFSLSSSTSHLIIRRTRCGWTQTIHREQERRNMYRADDTEIAIPSYSTAICCCRRSFACGSMYLYLICYSDSLWLQSKSLGRCWFICRIVRVSECALDGLWGNDQARNTWTNDCKRRNVRVATESERSWFNQSASALCSLSWKRVCGRGVCSRVQPKRRNERERNNVIYLYLPLIWNWSSNDKTFEW